MTTYYSILTGEGGILHECIAASDVERLAQECADERREPVYYSQSGGADLDPDDDLDIGAEVTPTPQCEAAR